MGFEVGDVISRTIANIVVPQFLDDNDDNPVVGETQTRELFNLREEIRGQTGTTFDENQK